MASISSFLDYIKFERRYSEHTLTSYTNDLKQFTQFLSLHFEFDDLLLSKHIHVRTWIVHMMQNEINTKSINRKISSLKSFFNFHKKQGNLVKSPMVKIIAPKIAKRLPKYIEQKQASSLLDAEHYTDDFAGARDALLIDLLYSTGMRRAELIGLKESDVNYYKSLIKVLGKGSKERLIPISSTLINKIKAFIKYKEEAEEPVNREFLLVTDAGKPMYPKYVFNKVKKYLALVTTLDKKSPHVLRHTFATHLANNGAELNAIKALLGHASLAATQVYTHNTIEQLKSVYQKAHPKAK